MGQLRQVRVTGRVSTGPLGVLDVKDDIQLNMKVLIVNFICGVIMTSCFTSPLLQPTTTPKFSAIPIPTSTYFIPEKEPRESVIATLPKSDVVGYTDKEIARLLLEELLNQMKAKEDSDIHKIKDYEITYFSLREMGTFGACYIVTPSSDNFLMVNQQKLDDGRIKICYIFGVAKDQSVYYLSGYFGG